MEIILIAAISQNYVIGNNGQIPWRISEDMKRFKELTTGKTVVMGRKTYESIGRALPKRKNIVVTKIELQQEGIIVAHSIDDALEQCSGETYIIGGQQIYEQTIERANKLEITHVYKTVEGDAYFPRISELWQETARVNKEGYSFVTYEKFERFKNKNHLRLLHA